MLRSIVRGGLEIRGFMDFRSSERTAFRCRSLLFSDSPIPWSAPQHIQAPARASRMLVSLLNAYPPIAR